MLKRTNPRDFDGVARFAAHHRATVANHEGAHSFYAHAWGLEIHELSTDYGPGTYGHVRLYAAPDDPRSGAERARAVVVALLAPAVLGFDDERGTFDDLRSARAAAVAFAPKGKVDEWLDDARDAIRAYAKRPGVGKRFTKFVFWLGDDSRTIPGDDVYAYLVCHGSTHGAALEP